MRLALVALLAFSLAGCSGADDDDDAASGRGETPKQFAVRITSLLRDGRFDAAWQDLHPEHQKLVTRQALADCWTQTDDVLNNPDVALEVTRVQDEDWEIPGTSLTRPSKAITVQAVVRQTEGERVLETWTQHAFAVEGRGWTWILAPALLEDARTSVC